MGKKVAVVYALLVVFGLVLQAVSTNVRWHAVRFMLGPKTLFRMQTSLLYVKVEKGSNIMCSLSRRLQPGSCDILEEGVSLQDAADEWCAPLVREVFPQPCTGFQTAYFLGLANLFGIGINALLMVVCVALIIQYMEGTFHKGVYRVSAAVVHSIANLLSIACFVAYICVAITSLDSIGGKGIPVLAMASKGSGISIGIFIMGSGLLFQVIAAFLLVYMKLGDEETDEEREIRQWQKDDVKYWELEQQFAQMGYSGYNAGGYGYENYGSMGQAPYDASQNYGAAYGDPAAFGQMAAGPPAPGAVRGIGAEMVAQPGHDPSAQVPVSQ
mmetsp:Transcript_17158/g.32349  ORF Transcript_17158/g.32349 Transcript_17158/m.32349 type:complete len:327 (+) Transcript_17158:66-1046(+)